MQERHGNPLPLLLFFLATVSLAARAEKPDAVSSALYSEALDFVIEEGERDSFLAIETRILQERPDDLSLVPRLLAYHLAERDRVALVDAVRRLRDSLRCGSGSKKDSFLVACREAESLWLGNLDSVFFHNDSDRKFENARRLLERRDCSGAAAVLKEIEGKEGLNRKVLLLLKEAYSCLSDALGERETDAKIKEVSFFGA